MGGSVSVGAHDLIQISVQVGKYVHQVLEGNYKAVVIGWRAAFDKAVSKERHTSKDTSPLAQRGRSSSSTPGSSAQQRA